MKKVIKVIVSAMLMWVVLAIPAFAIETITATPSNNPIECSGTIIENIPVYKINGENYFKLRDIGYLMDFGVVWNDSLKCIEINSSAHSDGLQVSTDKATLDKIAIRSFQPIYINGILNTDMTAYLIDGNNYFKLRDLANKVDFGCLYNTVTGIVSLDKTYHYDKNNVFGRIKDENKTTNISNTSSEQNTKEAFSEFLDAVNTDYDDLIQPIVDIFQYLDDEVTYGIENWAAHNVAMKVVGISDLSELDAAKEKLSDFLDFSKLLIIGTTRKTDAGNIDMSVFISKVLDTVEQANGSLGKFDAATRVLFGVTIDELYEAMGGESFMKENIFRAFMRDGERYIVLKPD